MLHGSIISFALKNGYEALETSAAPKVPKGAADEDRERREETRQGKDQKRAESRITPHHMQ